MNRNDYGWWLFLFAIAFIAFLAGLMVGTFLL